MTTPKIDLNDTSFASGTIGVRAYNTLAAWDNISVKSLLVTDIQTEKTAGEICLYPNPATDNLSIFFPQSGHLAVYDIAGKQMFSGDLPFGTTTLNTDNYENGVYLVKIITNRDTAALSRFIKR
jgi:hypothetical protein